MTNYQNTRNELTKAENNQISADDFKTTDVLSLAAGHWLHDTYTAFLAPILPALIDKFLLTTTEAGLLSIFMQGPSILQPVIGHMADRISLRYLVILAPGITATMMSLLGVAPVYAVLPVLLLVAGFSSASIHAIGPVMTGRVSGKRLGMGMSYWMVGGELGRTLGPILLVSAISYLTLEGLAWLMLGGWTASVVLYFRLRTIPGRPEEVNDSHWREMVWEMRGLMLPLALLIFFRAFINVSITTYLPVFLSEEGVDLFFAGTALSILEGAGVIGAFLGGSLSDRWGRRSVLYFAMLTAPLLTLMFLFLADWQRFVVLVPLGLVSLSTAPVLMAIVQESFPDNRALANGVYMAINFIIRAIVVVIVGIIADELGFRTGFIISSVLMLIGTTIISRLPADRRAIESAS